MLHQPGPRQSGLPVSPDIIPTSARKGGLSPWALSTGENLAGAEGTPQGKWQNWNFRLSQSDPKVQVLASARL